MYESVCCRAVRDLCHKKPEVSYLLHLRGYKSKYSPWAFGKLDSSDERFQRIKALHDEEDLLSDEDFKELNFFKAGAEALKVDVARLTTALNRKMWSALRASVLTLYTCYLTSSIEKSQRSTWSERQVEAHQLQVEDFASIPAADRAFLCLLTEETSHAER